MLSYVRQPRAARTALAAFAALLLFTPLAVPAAAQGLQIAVGEHETPPDPPGAPREAAAALTCNGGQAGDYPCHDVDLVAFVPRFDLGLVDSQHVNDIWGWTDPQSGIEYALVGLSTGTAFVSLEDPMAPRWLGTLPTRSVAATWRDLKVYADHVFIVADVAAHGMQVFDLTRLRGVTSPRTWTADAEYAGPGLGASAGFFLTNTHNIAIDEETGFAYLVGTSTCRGGLHMIDVRNPRRPIFAGCFDETGYIHDTQCVVYRGPDAAFQGREVCFNAGATDSFSVVDVTDKRDPRLLSRQRYPGQVYAHQGWLTEDHRYFLLDDEIDELQFGHNGRTYVFDVSNLSAPVFMGFHEAASPATDHNLYVVGHYVYETNYLSGLRVLEMEDLANAELREVAYFDTVPEREEVGFGGGAWSSYPWFASGIVIVSSTNEGLFVLRPLLHEDDEHGGTAVPPADEGPTEKPQGRVLGRGDRGR